MGGWESKGRRGEGPRGCTLSTMLDRTHFKVATNKVERNVNVIVLPQALHRVIVVDDAFD